MEELTLGRVWKQDVVRNKEHFQDIITTAQGELALEEFIKQLRETWENFYLDLVIYQKGKCSSLGSYGSLNVSP